MKVPTAIGAIKPKKRVDVLTAEGGCLMSTTQPASCSFCRCQADGIKVEATRDLRQLSVLGSCWPRLAVCSFCPVYVSR
jgi:hypothetical protein